MDFDNIDIIMEYDEYNEVNIKEQSLVFSFENNPNYIQTDPENMMGGIEKNHAILISNSFPSLGDKAQSYFAYKNMEMFVHGGDPASYENCTWCSTDSSKVDLLFKPSHASR